MTWLSRFPYIRLYCMSCILTTDCAFVISCSTHSMKRIPCFQSAYRRYIHRGNGFYAKRGSRHWPRARLVSSFVDVDRHANSIIRGGGRVLFLNMF